MAIDNSIVTKYELSEREKILKRAFLENSSKTDNQSATAKSMNQTSKKFEPSTMAGMSENEEMMNKLIDENIKKIKNNSGNSIAFPSQLGMIYSQNKILERNVDILHETQRSLHDLLVYNLKKDGTEISQKQIKAGNDERSLKEILNPLYSNIEEIKNEIQLLHSKKSQLPNEIDQNKKEQQSNFNLKVNDMMARHSQLKESTSHIKKSLELVEQNKKYHSDNTVLKAIDELKVSLTQMNKEMLSMEKEFDSKFKTLIEENEKKNLTNLIATNMKSHAGRGPQIPIPIACSVSTATSGNVNGNIYSGGNIISNKRRDLDSMDYVEYKNELLDIHHRKEEILNEFNTHKLVVPRVIQPTEKISFSYSLDYDNQPFTETDNEFNLNKSGKNIFMNNMGHQGDPQEKKNSKQKQTPSHQSRRSVSNSKTGITSPKMATGLHAKQDIQEDDKENRPMSEDEKIKEMNIADKMALYRDKMTAARQKQEEQANEEKNKKTNVNVNVNVNPSTKHSVQSTQPSSQKFMKSPKIINTFSHHPPVVEENENTSTDRVKPQIKSAQDDLDTKPKIQIRKEIKVVDVTPENKNQRNILEDVVLKLCIDKLIKPQKSSSQKNVPCALEWKYTFPNDISGDDLRALIEKIILEYIRYWLRNGKKPRKKEPVKVEEEKKDKNIMSDLFGLLLGKLGDLEKALVNRQQANQVPQQEANVEEIIGRLAEKIKNSMNININLRGEPSPPQRVQVPQLQINSQSMEIEVKKEEKEKEKEEIYEHPFSNTKRVNYQELDELIQMPHMINLNEYNEISSVSASYIEESKRVKKDQMKDQVKKEKEIHDNSMSRGQVVTDQDIHSDNHSEASSHPQSILQKNKTGFDLLMLKTFNENLHKHLLKIPDEREIDSNKAYSDGDKMESSGDMKGIEVNNNNNNNDNQEYSDPSLNNLSSKREIVSLNNTNKLKLLKLYESDEYNLFKQNFGQPDAINIQGNTNVGNSNENIQDGSSSELKLYKTQPAIGSSLGKNRNNISTTGTPPMFLSFGNVLNSNRLAMTSGARQNLNQNNQIPNENIFSLSRVSNEEIENLIQRQNNVNDRLKFLANRNNNTITENSELDKGGASIQQKEEDEHEPQVSILIPNNNPRPKVYMTDESSNEESSHRTNSSIM